MCVCVCECVYACVCQYVWVNVSVWGECECVYVCVSVRVCVDSPPMHNVFLRMAVAQEIWKLLAWQLRRPALQGWRRSCVGSGAA